MWDGISVIVAVYNVREYLPRCIDSLLLQNFKRYEIIIVDDGSTDGCFEIVEKYFRENPEKIRLIRQKNAGLSAARNAGLSVAHGEYITFVDGDDYLEKNALTTLYTEIKRTRADIAVAGFFEDFSGFSKEINQVREEISFERAMEYMSRPDGYKFVVVWGKLYHRSLFSEVRFPLRRVHEDQYIIHELYYRSGKTVAIDKRLYHHLNRDDSISHSSSFSRHTDDIDALFLRADFLKERGLDSCLVFLSRQMIHLLDFYLRHGSALCDNREKCRYIKKVAHFLGDNFGRKSEIYSGYRSDFSRKYLKYKFFSCIYG